MQIYRSGFTWSKSAWIRRDFFASFNAHTLFFSPVPWPHTQPNAIKHSKVTKALLAMCATTNLDNIVYLEDAIGPYDYGIHWVVWNYIATLAMDAMSSVSQCSYYTTKLARRHGDRSLTQWNIERRIMQRSQVVVLIVPWYFGTWGRARFFEGTQPTGR